jgi:hypothetical protein
MLRSVPLLLLLPAVAFAQTPDAERAAQRNEDVEILRRLLNKAVGLPDRAEVRPLKAQPGGSTALRSGITNESDLPATVRAAFILGQPLDSHTTATPVGPFDGVYLPGAGVVFTLHVPAGAPTATHAARIGLNSSCSTCHHPQVHAAVPAAVSLATCTNCHTDVPKGEPVLSEWDRVKQAVRGDKPTPAEKPKADKPKAAVCEPGSLQSLVAGVLAANAKHVRHLGEKESVTVVVTFDEVAPVRRVWKGTTYYEPVEKAEGGKPVKTYEPRTKEEWVDPTAAEGGDVYALSNKPFTPDEVKKLSLGDLHLKQGKYKDATEAYGEGLSRFWQKPFKVSAPPNLTAEQKKQYADELQKGVRDAMTSYAKALLMADQPDRAKEALELATGFTAVEASPPTAAKPTTPAKLILTLSRADAELTKDAAKEVAAFKKLVKVDRVNFPK